MPSYPTSVFSPTSKSAGQVIQAAHVNDLQDEIVAIETGLTQGTAPLNSSNSTVGKLNVTGVSTLGGAVTFGAGVASTVSFASSVTFLAGVTFTVAPNLGFEAARVVSESTQSIATGTFTALTRLTAQDFITNSSMHSTAANVARLVPQSTGIFRATVQVRFTQNSSGSRVVLIRDSSGASLADSRTAALATTDAIVQATGTKRFDVTGGYLEAFAYQDTGSTLSLLAADTWFEMVKQ